MRKKSLALLAALLLSSALLSGCLGGSDDDSDASGDDNGVNGDDGTGDGNGNGFDNGDNGDDTPAPQEEPTPDDISETVSFSISTGAIEISPPEGSGTFNVYDEGWMTFEVTCGVSSMMTDSVTLTVYDPEENSVGSASFSFSPPEDPEPQTISVSGMAVGQYTIHGEGGALSGGADVTCDVSVTY